MRSRSEEEPMMSHFSSFGMFFRNSDHVGGSASFPRMEVRTSVRNSAQTLSRCSFLLLVLSSTASSMRRSLSAPTTASQASSSPKRFSKARCALSGGRSCSIPASSALASSSRNTSRLLFFTEAVCFRLSLSIFLASASKSAFRAFWPGTAVKRSSYISLGSHFSYLSKGFTPFSMSICLNLRSMSFSFACFCSSATCFSRCSCRSAFVGFVAGPSVSAFSAASASSAGLAVSSSGAGASTSPAAVSTPSSASTSLLISGGHVHTVFLVFLWKKYLKPFSVSTRSQPVLPIVSHDSGSPSCSFTGSTGTGSAAAAATTTSLTPAGRTQLDS
mmetsp:Transcript_63230/g.150806  ORF Transcript_63230/g.150806 Transcript_63230/m.150806 type:complete len:331 (-) Transcript_63230:523-1515(-)